MGLRDRIQVKLDYQDREFPFTVNQLLDRYEKEIMPHKKPKTQEIQKFYIQFWRKHLGEEFIGDILPEQISKVVKHMERTKTFYGRPHSATSINRHLALLSHFFSVCNDIWGYSFGNPVKGVPKKPREKARQRFLSKEEIQRFLYEVENCNCDKLHAIVLIALTTGARKGEILKLQVKDVSFSNGSLTFRDTKNGETRSVPLVEPALSVVADYMQQQAYRSDSSPIFPSIYKNKLPHIRKPFELCLKKAKIQDFRFHDLRHTAASYLAMSGCSPIEIADILGHKTLEMVKRYSHLNQKHRKKVATKLSGALFKGR